MGYAVLVIPPVLGREGVRLENGVIVPLSAFEWNGRFKPTKNGVEQRKIDWSWIWTFDLQINVLALYQLNYRALMLAVSLFRQYLCLGMPVKSHSTCNYHVARRKWWIIEHSFQHINTLFFILVVTTGIAFVRFTDTFFLNMSSFKTEIFHRTNELHNLL